MRTTPLAAAAAALGVVAGTCTRYDVPVHPLVGAPAYLAAGGALGPVVQSRKGRAAAVPFQQTVILQSRLLG